MVRAAGRRHGTLQAYLLIFILTHLCCTLVVTQVQESAAKAEESNTHTSCRYHDFFLRKQACEHSYHFLSARNDSGCPLIQVYVDCVSHAMLTTSCTVNPFFKASETVIVQKKLAEKNLTCRVESEILSIGGHNNRGCLRVRAVKLFFHCGSAFHVSSERNTLTHATLCDLLKTYEKCGNAALEEANCTEDTILRSHVSYFIQVSMTKYGTSCPNITTQSALPKAAKVVMMRQSKECLIEEALRRYFTCGSNFLWKMVIWKRHYARHKESYGLSVVSGRPKSLQKDGKAMNEVINENEELCTGVKEFQECTLEITSNQDCPHLSSLRDKMLTMQDILLGDATKLECKYAPVSKYDLNPYYSRQNLPPPGCSYRKLIKQFSYCTVNFFSSFSLAKDKTQGCMFLGRHATCVDQARRSTGCGMKVRELEDFVYLTNVVQDKYASYCKGQEASKLDIKKDMAGVPMLCKKKTLLQKYFECNYNFQNRQAQKKEQCQALGDFHKCFYVAKADTQCTYTDDQFLSLMQMQTELMIDTVKSQCTRQTADLKMLLKCSQADALKKMLLCGLSYNRLLEDLKKQGEYYVTATTCSYLAEYKHCMIDVERSTGCTKSQLYQHTSSVLNFWTWNVAPLCESAAPLLLTDSEPKCDYPRSLSKAIKCAMDFQVFAEQTTWDSLTSAQSCSSLETLEQCMKKSLQVRQCKHSLSAKSQVSIFKALLSSEYRLSCMESSYQSAPGLQFRKYEDDEYLSDDYYYFGDEIVRTPQPSRNVADMKEGKQPVKQRLRAGPDQDGSSGDGRSQQSLNDLRWRAYLEEARLRFMGISIPEKSTPLVPDFGNSSSEQLTVNDTTPGLLAPNMRNEDTLCDRKRYDEEILPCHRYIKDNARQYRLTLSTSDQISLQDNMCKLVERYRICMSEAARRNRCLVLLAETPHKVDMQLLALNLDMCISAGMLPMTSISVLLLSLVFLYL